MGPTHSCGITATQAGYCWGDNLYGPLGTGTSDLEATTPQPIAGGLMFEAIALGQRYTCGLTTGGEAYGWGSGPAGELGNGGVTERASVPVPTDPF